MFFLMEKHEVVNKKEHVPPASLTVPEDGNEKRQLTADDLDYSDSNVGLAQAQGVRKNISLKLKGKGRGRGRRGSKVRRGSSKKVSGNTEDEVEEPIEEVEEIASEKQLADSNLEDVISKLETPAFSPMDRTFPEPLHQNKKLRWDHKVNLIGEKVIDPLIHCCEKCSLPILNYGRMIPCKHVFCYDCAKKSDKICPKCEEKIQRTEPSALGTVFMCTFGGTRHSPGSCGRTYLSQRDLQAHINHRHMKPSSSSTQSGVSAAPTSSSGHVSLVARDPRDPRSSVHLQQPDQPPPLLVGHLQPQQQDHSRDQDHPRNSPAGQSRPQPQYPPHSPASYPSAIPVSSARPNLITVPIQDDQGVSSAHNLSVHQSHVPTYATSTPHQPPMQPPPQQQQQHPGATPYGSPYQQQPQQSSAAYSSQAPPITTLTFSQPPPPVHHGAPPQLGAGGVYSAPPPPPVHHGATYSAAPPPRAPPGAPPRQQPMHPPPPPPQRFHEEGTASYMPPQWGGATGVPPPPSRASLPPRPIAAPPPPSASNPNVGLLTPRGPGDSGYRQPYYQ